MASALVDPGTVLFACHSEGDLAPHPWQQTYGHHSGNEIYHIQLHKSIFFSRYEGYRFTQASAEAHQRSVQKCAFNGV